MAPSQDEFIPTRATLLHRLKDWQDDASWQDFFDTYWRLIYDLGIKCGLTPGEAQDMVQETLVVVAKQIPTFKYDPTIGSFKSWLYNITRWRITDQLRKREPASSLSGAVESTTDTGTGTSTVEKIPDGARQDLDCVWDTEWENNLLESAMNKVKRRMDPQKYQIFDLYVNKSWPPEKVADAFGISTNQVYLAKHRVTDMIKEEVVRLQKEIT